MVLLVSSPVAGTTGETSTVKLDPLTRHLHIRYQVPADAPDEVVAVCSWSAPGANDWRPAEVMPLLSQTARKLLTPGQWKPWTEQSRITERRAAGLERTIVFNPYPEAQKDGRVDVDFRVRIESGDGKVLAMRQVRVKADNTDVVYVEDFSRVMQRGVVVPEAEPKGRKWSWRTGLDPSAGATLGNALYGKSAPDVPLPPLSCPLELRGPHAVFVCSVPGSGAMHLRLSGDERAESLASRHPHEEVFWRWARMDRQHLVLKQPHNYTGYTPAHIDYVKLVPLSQELADQLDARFGGRPDKLVVGYFEPYSWAFSANVTETLQHREPLSAFADARIGIVDIQIGRFGCKVVYESRLTDPLYHSTIGDPIGSVVQPRTDNVGKMQQFTNTLATELRYARELGLVAHANFGASNCYPGTPLQGDFSRKHPEWMRGSMLRFEVPEVKEFALNLYRETLEIGAPGISLDFCRYPETIDKIETANAFLRDLRALADEFGTARGKRVPILVRFPGTGVRRCKLFDYATWAREGWIDYLCPSNIQGRHMHIDITPYVDAVRGTKCTLLPSVDALGWGLPMPGPFLWRVGQLYDAGLPGVHIYQADGRILSHPEDRRTIRMLASSGAVRRWLQNEAKVHPLRSKGIYITPPHQFGRYHGWERLRVWTDGIEPGPMELLLDGKVATRCEGPPYLLGTEENQSDGIIPPGKHELRIRAKDGNGWLEQTFTVEGPK